MQKKIAILLNNSIYNDARVIKVINTLSKSCIVHLFYINGDEQRDKELFNENVTLFSSAHTGTLKVKLLRHSLFCFEFNFFKKIVLSRNVNYDYVWANDLPTLYPAYIIAKKIKAQVIYDSHEIYVETINQFFPLKSNPIKQFVINLIIRMMRIHGNMMEKWLIPKTTAFVTVNQSLLDYFKTKNSVPNGIVLMNLPLRQSYEGSSKKIDYLNKFGWDSNSLILIYQGELNEGRGLKLLINSVNKALEQIKLVIVGNGVLKESLKEQVNKLGLLERVKFIDTVPLKMLPEYTRGANVGINFLEDINLSKKMASPNKLFEYIHAGIPVICSNTMENNRVIKEHRIGYIVDNNLESIVSLMNIMVNVTDKEFVGELDMAKQRYCWENQENILFNIIK